MIQWFKSTFKGRFSIYEVRKRVALKRARNNGVSIFNHGEDCDMEDGKERIISGRRATGSFWI